MWQRILWGTLLLSLVGLGSGQAADYQITVTLDAEDVAALQKRYPGATAAQIRAKIGQVCTERITRESRQEVETLVDALQRRYREATPEQKTTIRETLEGLVP